MNVRPFPVSNAPARGVKPGLAGMLALGAVLALSAALPACAPIAVRPAVSAAAQCPPRPEIPLGTRDMLRYHACLDRLPAADAAAQYAAVSRQFAQTNGESDRIKLALLLARPDTPFHDTPAALKLLKEWPEAPRASSTGLRDLAGVLAMLLEGQQHSDDEVTDLKKALAAEKARSAYLQDKIDAVKNLETDMKQEYRP